MEKCELVLKNWLREQQRSASWLARCCDVSPTAVKYWLDGITVPSLKHRKKIKKITGIVL